MLELRPRVVVATFVVLVVAATGAGWKWAGWHSGGKKGAGHTHRIAGWTWDSAALDRDVR